LSHTSKKLTFSNEPSIAYGACKRLDAQMPICVIKQRLFCFEINATHCTMERL